MMYHMSTTLTVRTDEELDTALRRRAREEGLSLSELVRRVLEDAVRDAPLADRAGHLRGRLRLHEDTADAWRAQIRERNWRR